MISDLLSNILLLIATGFNFLLTPINNFLGNNLPNVNTALSQVSNFFTYISLFGSWVVSFFGLYTSTISIIIDGLLAPILISIVVYPIKLGIQWFNMLKIG